MNQTEMLHQMCHSVLSEADIKAICKNRGLPGQAASSRSLLESLFVSDTGVAAALAALDRTEIALLHLLKAYRQARGHCLLQPLESAQERAVVLRHVYPAFPGRVLHGERAAGAPRDPHPGSSARQTYPEKTNMERWQFALPVQFERHLPPLVESVKHLDGEGDWRSDVAREKLRTAVRSRSRRQRRATTSSKSSIANFVWGASRSAPNGCWHGRNAAGRRKRPRRKRRQPTIRTPSCPAEAVVHILAGLDAGLWGDVDALAVPLEVFCGFEVDSASVCESGWRWGCLARQECRRQDVVSACPAFSGRRRLRRTSTWRSWATTASPWTWTPPRFESLEKLVMISDQRAAPGGRPVLLITPNLVKLGRAADAILALPLADWLQKNSPAFRQAIETVRQPPRQDDPAREPVRRPGRRPGLESRPAKKRWATASCCWAKIPSLFLKRRWQRSNASWPNWDTSSRRCRIVEIEPIDVARLEVPTRLPDLRRDLHVFVDYVRGREVKRSHRGNALSKADAKRLAKLMSDAEAAQDVDETGSSAWIDFVDDVALKLGFVHYDTKGEYAGYTSQEPSFPDNYIEFQEKPYTRFLAAKAAQQETTLLEAAAQGSSGRSQRVLSDERVGAAGRVQHLGIGDRRHAHARFRGRPPLPAGAFGGVSHRPVAEHGLAGRAPEEEPSLFPHSRETPFQEQVGGEGGPLRQFPREQGLNGETRSTSARAMRTPSSGSRAATSSDSWRVFRWCSATSTWPTRRKRPKAIYPSLGCLQAFRVSERLRRALQGRISEPRVIVTPNFDVHVQAETYPAGVLSELAPLCEMVSEGTSIVLKLNKQKVAAARAADPKLDAAGLLQALSGGELPANVARELSVLVGARREIRVVCRLFPAGSRRGPAGGRSVHGRATGSGDPHRPLAGQAVRRVGATGTHAAARQARRPGFFAAAQGLRGPVFRKRRPLVEKPRVPKTRVTLTRVTRVQLVCPDREFVDKLHRLLTESKCPAEMDRKNLMLTYSKQYESEVSNAIRRLKTEYQIEIEDVP